MHFCQKCFFYCYEGSCSGENKRLIFFYLFCASDKSICISPSLVFYASFTCSFYSSVIVHVENSWVRIIQYSYFVVFFLSGIWHRSEKTTFYSSYLKLLFYRFKLKLFLSKLKHFTRIYCPSSQYKYVLFYVLLATDPNNDIIYAVTSCACIFHSLLPFAIVFFIKSGQPFSVRKMRNWCAPLFETHGCVGDVRVESIKQEEGVGKVS